MNAPGLCPNHFLRSPCQLKEQDIESFAYYFHPELVIANENKVDATFLKFSPKDMLLLISKLGVGEGERG